ncbi:SRPBCC family protein [Actinoallomurus iriomotensis]|uniref:Coenzyme Q-binding protein COQ10 START domain-containing protein n=1 Tax=Actinoallomurus iriomotensis TaxID=478107 RepID=A0A9W6VZ53_9ACTN|nr:SRPBCC family protein [Actinoallomurus iriomotensis]GLY85550.1 hypothetical protein Airi02_034790 [Actinoallomurus iriomotensis]
MDEGRHRRAGRPARALGWTSLGLGVARLAAPGAVRRLAGVDDSAWARLLVPLAGVRELCHAAVLLGSRVPGPWVWSRVAGDAVDLALMGCATARRGRARRRRAAAATAAVAGLAAVDLTTALRRGGRPWDRETTLHAAITVRRPREEVYRFWRDLANLPRFTTHLESVTVLDDRYSRWTVRGPAGRTVEWDAEIVEDRPGAVVAWHASRGAAAAGGGEVRFADAPGRQGTEVRVALRYTLPYRAAVARLLGEHPEQRVRDDLRRFKQVMETGEVVRSEGAPEGAHAMRLLRRRPARPVATGGAP